MLRSQAAGCSCSPSPLEARESDSSSFHLLYCCFFSTPALLHKSLFEAKDDSRKQAAEAEKAKEVAVEEAVSRAKRQVDESMSETYRWDTRLRLVTPRPGIRSLYMSVCLSDRKRGASTQHETFLTPSCKEGKTSVILFDVT